MADNGEVRFVITGDASGLESAATQARASMTDLKRAVDSTQASAERLEDSTAAAGRAVETLAVESGDLAVAQRNVARASKAATVELRGVRDAADRLDKASQVLSPRLQGVFTGVKNLAESAGGLSPRIVAVGVAAGGAVAGVAALTAAAAALAAGVVSVVASADQYVERLESWERRAYDVQIAAATEAQQAIQGLGDEASKTAFLFSAQFAPDIESAADAMRGLVIVAREGTGALSVRDGLGYALSGVARIAGEVVEQGLRMSMTFGALTRVANAFGVDVGRTLGELPGTLGGFFEEVGRGAREMDDILRLEEEMYAALGLTGEATKETTAATQQRSVASERAAKAIRVQTAAEVQILSLLRAQAAARAAGLNAPDVGALNVSAPASSAGDGGAADIQAANQEAASNTQVAWQDAFGAIGQGATQLTGILSAGFADLSQSTTASAREAAKKQFAITKASALVQATMQTALAVVSALATTGGLGYAAAAISGAAGAAQIAFIAAQKMPSFHRGGIRQLAPDEQVAPPAVVRTNEASVVMTRDAMRTMGGADGIARMNAGLGGAQGGGSVYLVLDDGGLARARPLARPSMGLGRSRR